MCLYMQNSEKNSESFGVLGNDPLALEERIIGSVRGRRLKIDGKINLVFLKLADSSGFAFHRSSARFDRRGTCLNSPFGRIQKMII